jgi:hypothetical protein
LRPIFGQTTVKIRHRSGCSSCQSCGVWGEDRYRVRITLFIIGLVARAAAAPPPADRITPDATVRVGLTFLDQEGDDTRIVKGTGPWLEVEGGARWRMVTLAAIVGYSTIDDSNAKLDDLPPVNGDYQPSMYDVGVRCHVHVSWAFVGVGLMSRTGTITGPSRGTT